MCPTSFLSPSLFSLVGLLCAACAPAKPAAQPRQRVACRWPGLDFTTAEVAACRDDCDRGQTAACANLGFAYLHGRGTEKNKEKARPAFERACAANQAAACYGIGAFDFLPPETAPKYLDKGCALGSGEACSSLAGAYEDGKGVPQNDVRAFELQQRSCDLGYKIGCTFLGFLYLQGKGVAADEARGLKIFEAACVPGDVFDTTSCKRAAMIYDQGGAVPRDVVRARYLYELACKGGHDDACAALKALH